MTAPIVILTHGSSGDRQLRLLLQRVVPDIFCTQTTGIITACHAALHAWHEAERLPATRPASLLAVRSVRAMTDSMITIMAARYGGRTWCETATADPAAAASFLTVIPQARILCLHRSYQSFVSTVLNDRASDAEQPPTGFSVPDDDAVTAISAWWAARAASLLDLESDRPDKCLRVRFEDLVVNEDIVAVQLSEFLRLESAGEYGLAPDGADTDSPAGNVPDTESEIPLNQLPPALAEKINSIQLQLGYLRPRLAPSEAHANAG
jgi:hypothetical protein